MWEALIPIVATGGLFAMIAFIVKVTTDAGRRKEQLKALSEFHSRLLDKFGSSSDFGQFLQSEGGARLLDTLSAERAVDGPRDRILRSVSAGVILAVVGVGLMVVGALIPFDDARGFAALGGICLALGIGFLLAAVVTFRLARSLGLLDSAGEPRDRRA